MARWAVAAERFYRTATIIKASDEDVRAAWGGRVSIAEAAHHWLDCGARLVVVTEGAKGVTAFCAAGHVLVQAHSVVVRDTVGAGDTFHAALLAQLAKTDRLSLEGIAALDLPAIRDLLGYAVAAAAVTVARDGADLPTAADVEASLAASVRLDGNSGIESRKAPTSSRVIPVAPFVLTVFGATGDLARRKLLPALIHRDFAGQLPEAAIIVGAARRAMGRDAFIALARDAIVEHVSAAQTGGPELDRFLARLQFVAIDAEGEDGWAELARVMAAYAGRVQVYYLATAPQLFGPICEKLGRHGLAGTDARVVIEKPIGKDLASAIRVNQAIGKVFSEERVYRIDHYLGKETVQNLMALRFANALFEPLWNAAHIDHVQMTVAEAIGVEGRGAYYDGSGALQDMVQNHLQQLLCLIAMGPPNSLEADAVRDEKLKVLKSLARIDDSNVAALTVLGQCRPLGCTSGLPSLTQTGPSESVATLDRGPRLEDHVTLSELGRIDEAF
jgi:hypothetical protein